MKSEIILTCFILVGCGAQFEEYNNETNSSETTVVTEVWSTESPSDFPTTSEESPDTTTLKVSRPPITMKPPSATLSPAITGQQYNAVCWCDLTVGTCDMNCCCDTECSVGQKHVFTHCLSMNTPYDPGTCYSSNFLYRKPSSIKETENDGLFCLVRDNLSRMREYKPRPPITSLEEFNRLTRKWLGMQHMKREMFRDQFPVLPYSGDGLVWTVMKGVLQPFEIFSPLFGDLCLTTKQILYLRDSTTTCKLKLPRHEPACFQDVEKLLLPFWDVKIISSSQNFNASELKSIENCSLTNGCIPMTVHLCKLSLNNCAKLQKISNFPRVANCQKFGLQVNIDIHHNGTEGIQSVNTFILPLNTSTLKVNVRFLWSEEENVGFTRSGNPGYIIGKPILAGRRVEQVSNESTMTRKEAIQLSVDPKEWLTIAGSEKGSCSNLIRQPVLYGENIRKACFFKAEKKYINTNGCFEMQKIIVSTLLGENINFTTSSWNKFVGVFGNSKVDVMSDWLQIILDSLPLLSATPSFENSSYWLSCKGIVTHLYIDIAVAKFGSFANPQAKIVGVLFRFGSLKRIFVKCKSTNCEEISSTNVKVVTEVNFVDVTRPAVREFAQPPGLEVKLPHDFFYPFFSAKASCTKVSTFFFISVMFSFILH